MYAGTVPGTRTGTVVGILDLNMPSTDAGAVMPLVPSQAQKQQQKLFQIQVHDLEDQNADLEARAAAAELRVTELEVQRDEIEREYQLKSEAAYKERAAREAQLKEAAAQNDIEWQHMMEKEQRERAVIEEMRSSLAVRVEELKASTSKLQEQYEAEANQRILLLDKLSETESKLATALADKRGLENISERSERQWKEMLDVQVQGLTHERSALEARLEATESKLAKAIEQRDAEAASVISLRERLAAAQAEGVSLHDRLRQAEALLGEAREVAASERAKLDEKLAAAVAAREDADKRREAALTELATLQAQVVSLSSERSSALAAQVSLVNEPLIECDSRQ